MTARSPSAVAFATVVAVFAAACGPSAGTGADDQGAGTTALSSVPSTETSAATTGSAGSARSTGSTAGAGVADPSGSRGVYAFTGPDDLSPRVEGVPFRAYVPNSRADSVTVIDPETFEVVDRFPVGDLPHHVTPSWDLSTLYVGNTRGNTLTPIDPMTGEPGEPIPVEDPYNLYFTPDGAEAVVVAERLRRLDVRDPRTWELLESVEIPCTGPDHLDFGGAGDHLLLSCEFSGEIVKVDTGSWEVTEVAPLGELPVDVRLAPDGQTFYVADQGRHGVIVVDPDAMEEVAFLPTGRGAHGIYPSRDATEMYVTNRLEGTISVVATTTDEVVDTWEIGGSPDMGGVSPDGSQFWVTGRHHASVYVVDTRTGELIHRIPVGAGAHGLALFPQPGRFSLGHTGNYR